MPARAASVDPEDQEAIAEFHALVNMTGRELDRWLSTDESQTAELQNGGTAPVSESARRVVSILGKRRLDYNSGDVAHMRKAVGYIKRYLAQTPASEAEAHWRHSLMNWGHDPDRPV